MVVRTTRIDSVRSSRDGHEFHENWTARVALRLLWPESDLVGIAMEGLDPEDQRRAEADTVQIADLVQYRGGSPGFERAESTTIVQVKYSVSDADSDFRASDAKYTVAKFASAYLDHQVRFGPQAVRDRLNFLIVTNRPVYRPLELAVAALADGNPTSGEVQKQSEQLRRAAERLTEEDLRSFAARFRIDGRQGSLPEGQRGLRTLMVDWAGGSDLHADSRLGTLKQMIRDKAGSKGAGQNLITRPDILTALQVPTAEELLPAPAALVPVEDPVQREQLDELADLVLGVSEPLIVHGPGGVGKTVFLKSLGSRIDDRFEIVLFDCFGGGAYRSPGDARHLPHRGLIHIANTLAFRGLCDPILPGSSDITLLLRTFGRRLEQAVRTVREAGLDGVAVLIDAADNAIEEARIRSQPAFPQLLLESYGQDPIPGVSFVLSCRSHRLPRDSLGFRPFELSPFTHAEATKFLTERLPQVTESEIHVAMSRTRGNPRAMEYLIEANREELARSEEDEAVELKALIDERISRALEVGLEQGYREEAIDRFLVGLAVLPPPVPVEDLASAHGMHKSQIESFASDLSPLLEHTSHGLIFRDEPTETRIRERFAGSGEKLDGLAQRLLQQQKTSVYAARALPRLLQEMNDGERLFALAFDSHMPKAVKSPIGQRGIRFERVRAAASHAAREADADRLTDLLVELSVIASGDQRGSDYIVGNPDLAVLSGDPDAIRRLFESRTGWPGSRHARLTIAYVLAGETDEAHRHYQLAEEWIRHYLRKDPDEARGPEGPTRLDIAAVPFFYISQGRPDLAASFMKIWRDWYAFEVSARVFRLCRLAPSLGLQPSQGVAQFVDASTGRIGTVTATLLFGDLSQSKARQHARKLAELCENVDDLSFHDSFADSRTFRLQDGLRQGAAIALTLGLHEEAQIISGCTPESRPSLHSFQSPFADRELLPFLLATTIESVASEAPLHEKDLLPTELASVCSDISRNVTGTGFQSEANKLLAQETGGSKRGEGSPTVMSHSQLRAAEGFVAKQLPSLARIARGFADVLAAEPERVDERFQALITTCEALTTPQDRGTFDRPERVLCQLASRCAQFAFAVRKEVASPSVKRFLEYVRTQGVTSEQALHIVAILGDRQELHELAGEWAMTTRSGIEASDDVVHRAALLADLSHAILSASPDDAAAFFQAGLEQMDAIGSGDFQYTAEILHFASQMQGPELEPKDFHTLTNLCELSLGDDGDRFPWGEFARGISRVAGLRGLAKLSRWDDRNRVSFSYSLLPYLTALVDDQLLQPDLAVALNRLAGPAELYGFGSDVFAQAIHRGWGQDASCMGELIDQFASEPRNGRVPSAADSIVRLLKESYVGLSPIREHLEAARRRSADTAQADPMMRKHPARPLAGAEDSDAERDTSDRLEEIATTSDPMLTDSIEEALHTASELDFPLNLATDLLERLRQRVGFSERSRYIRAMCAVTGLPFHQKLDELQACIEEWGPSTAALPTTMENQAEGLLDFHALEILEGDHLNRQNLSRLSALTGLAPDKIAFRLVELGTQAGDSISGTMWLALASLVVSEASPGRGNQAISRLLRTDVAALSQSVGDGEWHESLYPNNDQGGIVAGMVWRSLGSPHAEQRWRAAHSLRSLARLGRWDVIASVVTTSTDDHGGPFQAPELTFQALHARLWLLIALARLAHDYPGEVAVHSKMLLKHLEGGDHPHVLMRHFSAEALKRCVDAGTLDLSNADTEALSRVNQPQQPKIEKKLRPSGGFYAGRPEGVPDSPLSFHLDYDFGKYDVDSLGVVFGQPIWAMRDLIAEIAHRLDPALQGMHDTDARERRRRITSIGMTSEYHTYPQYVGWHVLFIAAARLMRDHPVTGDSWEDDPWGAWLSRYVLTRDDGLWLADGTDKRPAETLVNLCVSTPSGPGVTGDRDTLLGLVGLTEPDPAQVMIDGRWRSMDDIRVRVSSALVPKSDAANVTRTLLEKEPFFVFLPYLEEHGDGEESPQNEVPGIEPWIVRAHNNTRADAEDPFATPVANSRPRLSSEIERAVGLEAGDPFGRTWLDGRRRVGLKALAWGGGMARRGESEPPTGTSSWCAQWVLRDVLANANHELLVLVRLERYEAGIGPREAKFSHTVGVARVDAGLQVTYVPGKVNHLHRSKHELKSHLRSPGGE